MLAELGGGVIAAFSLALPVIVGAAALALDSANFYDLQARMQTVADSSALAVAKELHVYRDEIDELRSVGETRVEALLAESGIVGLPHSTDFVIDADNNLVEAQITMVAHSFLPVDVWGENPIRVTSLARAYGQSRLCVLALHETAGGTIKADDAAILTAPECAVQSNSRDPRSLDVQGGSRIVSTVICSVGGADGGAGAFEPDVTTDCPALDDPLAERQSPAVGGCDFLDEEIRDVQTSISPGTYCGGLKIDGDAEVTAEPGVYVFTGGKLEVTANATLTGEYVSFAFMDDAATLDFDKDTTISLSAPNLGAMAGILFYESAAAPLGRNFTIRSENAHTLLGTIYLPRGRLRIEAGNVAGQSAYTVIVANQIEMKGGNLVVNSNYGGTDVPVPEGLGPNSMMVKIDG
jgi:hypothetical protein